MEEKHIKVLDEALSIVHENMNLMEIIRKCCENDDLWEEPQDFCIAEGVYIIVDLVVKRQHDVFKKLDELSLKVYTENSKSQSR